MSKCLLIRHASTDAAGHVMTGRAPGIHLNEAGVHQARDVCRLLRRCSIRAIYASPLERALETARCIAEELELRYDVCSALTEVDFGSWSGLSVQELDRLPDWRNFNTLRSITAIPNGESMLEVQARVIRGLQQLRQHHASETFAVVTHADVIRAALANYLGIPLDLAQRIDIDPASVSIVDLHDDWIQVRGVNLTAAAFGTPIAPQLSHERD